MNGKSRNVILKDFLHIAFDFFEVFFLYKEAENLDWPLGWVTHS